MLGTRRWWVSGWCLLALCTIGCGEADSPAAATSSQPAGGEPRRGGEIVVALQADGKTLDPHAATDAASMRLIENMHAGLLRYGPVSGEFTGDLATSWEVSDDGLRYTFHLTPDARFHSGRPVTSEDVAYSIRRIIEQRVRADHFAALERIETPDDRTVVFHLREPMSPLLAAIAHPMNAVVDRAAVEAAGGSLTTADAGAGPFKLIAWRKDDHLTLARHDGYHVPGLPYLDRLTFRPISDETARSAAIRTGHVDLVLDVPEKDLPLVEAAPAVIVASAPGTFWEYIGLNTRREPFDDPRVRQAIAWGVDRRQLNSLVKFGRAQVLDGGVLPPHHWAHADLSIYPRRDIARAKQLLESAGFPEGFRTTLKVGSAFAYQVRAAQVVKQQLRDIGIDIELQTLESTVFFDALGRGEFDMTIAGWVGFTDPDQWLYHIFHSGGRYNQQGYASDDVDALLERGRAERDRQRRVAIYREAQRLIAADAPVVFLYVSPQTSAWRDHVRGFDVHPTATTRSLEKTWRR